MSDIRDYLKCILKEHDKVTDNRSIMINVNNIEYRITFEIKTEYYLQLLIPKHNEITRKQ